MARTLLWNVREQKAEGIFPDSTAANTARDELLAKAGRVDGKQFGRPSLSASDYQNVSVN